MEGCGEGGAMITRNSKWIPDNTLDNSAEREKSKGKNNDKVSGWGATALLAYSVLASDRCVSNGGSPLLQFQKEFQELAGYEPPLSILEKKNCIKVKYTCTYTKLCILINN